MWITVKHDEVGDLQRVYKYRSHATIKLKNLPWVMCRECGLLFINNAFTRWAIEKGCLNRFHKDHENKRRGR